MKKSQYNKRVRAIEFRARGAYAFTRPPEYLSMRLRHTDLNMRCKRCKIRHAMPDAVVWPDLCHRCTSRLNVATYPIAYRYPARSWAHIGFRNPAIDINTMDRDDITL